ncbi:MAG: hypothetical protein JW818_14470 [Pirellulales bacterium]|nr:hypothetical protein [Pirellulales bacterium]
MPPSAIHAFVEMLARCGVRYVFGNPGSTEMPLNAAMVDQKEVQYVLGLQEVPVVAMADGYAQASGRLGVANVHICCGLGNAMGMLYNAHRQGTPLLLTAGQQDRRVALSEPILWGDMVAAVRPWTKWAYEVTRADDLPSAVRRAVQTALTPPTGPVFLSLPVDLQMEPAELDTTPPRLPDLYVRPPEEALKRAVDVLASARRPGILVGSRVCEAGAIDELIDVAERLGAPVIHEPATSHGRASFPSRHSLSAALLPFQPDRARERLAEFDVLLVVGMKLLQQYIYNPDIDPMPEGVRVVHLDDAAWELGKNYPTEVGLIGHPKPSLAELARRLDSTMTSDQRESAQRRAAEWAETHAAQRKSLRAKARGQRDVRPMTPLCLMETLAGVLPDNVAVVEESPTTTMGGYFERAGALADPTGYFAQRGWALGWGLGCAIGVQMAWPDRPVLAVLGDGSALYSIQGLWTAAHYNVPVTFVLTNNRQYQILRDSALAMGLDARYVQQSPGLDMTDPPIDFVALAQSLGVSACHVDEPDALADWVRSSFRADRPQLVEVAVQRPVS